MNFLVGAALAYADFFWDSTIFEKSRWESFMNMLRVGLPIATAILLMYEARARILREKTPERWKRRIALGITVISFGVYFDFFNPNTRYVEYYHRHEFYHYYLGSKYFTEIGYNRLYECTEIAEVELGRGDQVRNRTIRDLRIDRIKPMAETYVLSNPEECKQHFTAERWEAWKKDVDWFYHSSAGNYWDEMRRDHGYNPPPVWTMTGKFFGSFGEAGDKFFKLLAGLDIAFHIGIIVALYWAFGYRAGTAATVFWACNGPGNSHFTIGAFLRQDWIFLLVFALCLTKKRRFFWAGAMLMWSSLLRIFPVVFFAGIGIIVLFEIIRRVRAGAGKGGILQLIHPDHRRFIGGALVALGVLVPASIAVSGINSYQEFFGRTLKVHKNSALTNNMGLETAIVHTWQGRMRFTADDNYDEPVDPWKRGRSERKEQRKPLTLALTAAIFAWTAWALRRTKLLWVGLILSLPLEMCATQLTSYYYSMFLIAPVLLCVRRPLGPAVVLAAAMSSILHRSFYWIDDDYTAQAWLFLAISLLLLYSYSRPFSVERLKAWWAGKPEPKATPPALPNKTEPVST